MPANLVGEDTVQLIRTENLANKIPTSGEVDPEIRPWGKFPRTVSRLLGVVVVLQVATETTTGERVCK